MTDDLNKKQYDAVPEMTIDPAKEYKAQVKMENGSSFTIQLHAEQSARSRSIVLCFSPVRGILTASPSTACWRDSWRRAATRPAPAAGGPGYQFENEDSDLMFDKAGVVAMANAGRDTNGSQFFITFGATPHLNGGYTIFGQVVEGMDTVNALTRRDPSSRPDFLGDVMESVTIIEE